MFCGNCGSENANDARFCRNCGNALGGSTGAQTAQQITPRAMPQMLPPQGTSPKGADQNAGYAAMQFDAGKQAQKKPLPKKALAGVCAAIVAVIVVICIVMKMGSTINLNDYLIMETSGYDGYGKVSVSIDWDAIQLKYGDKITYNTQATSGYGSLLSLMTPTELLSDCISVKLETTTGLSNGDMIAYTWDVDEEVFSYIKCNIKYKDGSYKVSGLTELATFDAFADLEVSFSGVAPDGRADINYNGTELSSYDFSVDQTSGLSNGDIITVTINDSRIESYAESLGRVPETLEKEYTVEGLTSYLSEIAQISAEGMASMQQQAEDVYNAYVAKNWDEGALLQSLTCIGSYLLTVKNQESYWGSNNIFYLVYKVQARNTYTDGSDTFDQISDIYWYIAYENLMVDPDGSLVVDVSNYSTPSFRFTVDSGLKNGWWSMEWYYYGYGTLDELYKDAVTAKVDTYMHEDNVDAGIAPAIVEQEAETEDVTDTADSGYVFPDSDTKLLTEADLQGLSAEECKIARNEIYARHGRKFKDETLQAYFDACDWYEGTVEPDDFQESDLNAVEIENKNLIVAYEEEMGYR